MFFRPLYFRKGVLGLTLALVFIKELIKSNIAVLRVVLNPWLRVRSGVIAVPTELTNDVALTMLANMITLTPGTLTLDISPDRRYLYVHTLNLDDPEDVKQEIRQAFEVYLFVFLSGPVGAHMIARAAYRSQVPLHERTIVNEWKTIAEDIAEPHRDA